jgi:hypothetical protein
MAHHLDWLTDTYTNVMLTTDEYSRIVGERDFIAKDIYQKLRGAKLKPSPDLEYDS